MNRYRCPCCGYLTLDESSSWEICYLCDWEDDGQDDPHADQVRGGANGDYSLTEARQHFQSHYTMYRQPRYDALSQDGAEEVAIKQAIMLEMDQWKNGNDCDDQWKRIIALENTLAQLNEQRMERYSANIEQHQETLQMLQSSDPKQMVDGLLALSLHAPDGAFAQHMMLRYVQHDNENVRGIAILGLGHIARIHGTVDKERVLPIVEQALQDRSEFVRGHADAAMDDIQLFCK
ncbi:CPCC family cysteine-rich protein [Paenibacillus kandeliae]|uniref:CPCC family cysteine-rich protein n=1 Tax=Paenibacillus kandeliae TaxID=3231269 RepID=UPI003458626B